MRYSPLAPQFLDLFFSPGLFSVVVQYVFISFCVFVCINASLGLHCSYIPSEILAYLNYDNMGEDIMVKRDLRRRF